MSLSHEESGPNVDGANYALPKKIDDLVDEIASQAQSAPGSDPVIEAMSSALLHLYTTNPTVAHSIEAVVTIRNMIYGNQGASQIAGIIRSSIMTDQITQERRPYEWTEPSQWYEPIREIFELANASRPVGQQVKRADELIFNLNHRFVMTNTPSRGIGEELLMQALYPQRFPNGYRWVDIGAALLEIPKQILAKDKYPFEEVTIVESLGGTILNGTTDKANDLLQRPHRVRSCVAVDLIDPRRDVPTWQWANGSLRPKEITNPVFMEKFTGLTQVHPTELKFFTGNLLDKDDLQGFHTNYDSEKADLVTMSTMLYQLNKSDRDTMLAIAQDLLTDEGLLVVKDFVYVQPNNLRSPRFYRKWHEPGRYRMLVFDKTDPQGNYAELYRAQDSRNLVLAAGCGKLAVRNQTLGFNQLIESA